MMQREVAKTMGVNPSTYLLWEQNKTKPEIRYWPKIISFLGFDPSPPAHTLGEKLKACRRSLGLSQAKLASHIGLDETSVWEWENDLTVPTAASFSKLSSIIG
jgi:transcriptional regulator with XRE-family HTH domain